MKGEHLIIKLSPKSISIGEPGGGIVEISNSDIAAALAYGKLPEMAVLYALAVFIKDRNTMGAFLGESEKIARQTALVKKWRLIEGRDTIEKCGRLAAYEHLEPHIGMCKTCGGSKYTLDRYRVAKQCKSCEGTGRRQITDRDMAEFIGVDRKTARECWRSRYDYLYQDFFVYEQLAAHHLYRQFSDDNKPLSPILDSQEKPRPRSPLKLVVFP